MLEVACLDPAEAPQVVVSLSSVLGSPSFRTAVLRGGDLPQLPLVLYGLGALPVSLQAFVPETALDLGLVALAVGTAWLAVWLFARDSRIDTEGRTISPPLRQKRRRLT